MNKRSWLMKFATFMIVMTMMVGVIGVGYTEDFDVTDWEPEASEEVTYDEPEPEPEPAAEPETEAEPEPAEEPEAAPEAEPEQDNSVVAEVEAPADSHIEEEAEDDEDFDFDDEDFEDFGDEDLEEFDDDEVGDVSEDLLQQFNNPDSFEQVEFSGSADIELLNDDWDENWDGVVTLIAQVQDTSLSYRLVWEANDGDNRGWFTVGSGNEYSYTLTKENVAREANREYRVVMFTVD